MVCLRRGFLWNKEGLFAVGHPYVFDLGRLGEQCFGVIRVPISRMAVVDPSAFEIGDG
jgi:hypothetical protein